MHHALTADLLPRLYSPEALMVHLRHLTDPHLHTLARPAWLQHARRAG